MNTDIIDIKVRTSGASSFKPFLKCYIPDSNPEIPFHTKCPAVLVCPGGGYRFRSFREDEPVALQYAAQGFASFVLEYSVNDGENGAKFPQALCEVAEAIKIIRTNAEKWNIDPTKIFVLGFSAGGHLAASIGTLYGSKEVLENLGGKAEDYRPDGMILCYPVISHLVSTHLGSFDNLLQDLQTAEMLEYLSLETQVSPNTPPAYIWATANDQTVPVVNSLVFATALANNGVSFELNIFKDGPHGLSLCSEYTANDHIPVKVDYQHWISDSIKWIKTF